MKVTFDSNVWEKLLSEPSDYPAIKDKILNRSISPYLCEISVSLESIQKSVRQRFFPNYRPTISVTRNPRPDGTTDFTIQVGPNHQSHPGLAPILLAKLLKAQEMGFRLLPMTNLGTVRSPQIPKDMRAAIEGWDDYWNYADRLSDCSEFIRGIGCGSHVYRQLKRSPHRDLDKELEKKLIKEFAKAVAEWADGDALSAHYAFGADVFCTNDRARGAGSRSIFHPNNLARLKEKFGIVVLSPDELQAAIG